MQLRTGIDFITEFGEAARRFVAAAAETSPREQVAACPGWSTYDLVVHLGNTHAWAATIVETGRSAVEQNDEPAHARPRTVSAWYAAKAEDLYRVLQASDPTASCWNFTGRDLTPRFWARRQTHETLVHLVDLDQASGRTTDVADRLCTDGIAEVLSVMVPRMYQRGRRVELSAPLSIRTTDVPAAWTLLPHGDRPPAIRPGVDPDADLLEGTASALFRLLWRRITPTDPAVSRTGDTARIDAFLGSPLTP